MKSCVKLENVCYRVGDVEILKNISVEITEGQSILIAGMSGSGKSTLLMLAAALIYPTEGTCYIFDTNVEKANQSELKSAQRKSGFLFQSSALIANMTIYQNIELAIRYFDNENIDEITAKVKRMIKKFHLEDIQHHLPAGLSFGKQKLAALARLLISDPPVVYLDEPFAGIDSYHKSILIEMIRDLKDKGKTLIVVSHNIDDMRGLCDHLWIIKEGKLKYNGVFDSEDAKNNPFVKEVINL